MTSVTAALSYLHVSEATRPIQVTSSRAAVWVGCSYQGQGSAATKCRCSCYSTSLIRLTPASCRRSLTSSSFVAGPTHNVAWRLFQDKPECKMFQVATPASATIILGEIVRGGGDPRLIIVGPWSTHPSLLQACCSRWLF